MSKNRENIPKSHQSSFLSVNLDMIYVVWSTDNYNSVCCPVKAGYFFKSKAGKLLHKDSEKTPQKRSRANANERCCHSPLNLSSESLSLSLLSSGGRHETDKMVFYGSQGNFTNMFISREEQSESSMWVAKTQMFTHLSGQWIKGNQRFLTSHRYSVNIVHGKLLQPLLPTFSAVNGVNPLDQLYTEERGNSLSGNLKFCFF